MDEKWRGNAKKVKDDLPRDSENYELQKLLK